jgi:hypothetical protein
METTIPQAPESGPAGPGRTLHEICEDARHGQCGYCCAMPGEPCAWRGPGLDSHGYHVARFAWAEAHGLISAEDMAAVLEAAGPFTTTTVVYDDKPEDAMSGAEDEGAGALGPFETSSDALMAVRPEDGSFTGREALFDLLKKTLHDTDVTLLGWDWIVRRWLADQDVQTVAAVAGWVGRGNGDLRVYGGGEGLEPYCAECGHWAGMFFGLEGWQHFKGDPAPGGQRQLFDATHAAVPAWCEPPGRSISPADAVTMRGALADAAEYRRKEAAQWCAGCEASPAEACEEHLDELDAAQAYDDLAAQLTDATEDGNG